ncbi:MAG: hypothetical protein DMG57_26160 [Acidobacteria bacterium]|nr:MAG: hypothetical protein DMG57_26160 [Acidobacteriota bacterium]
MLQPSWPYALLLGELLVFYWRVLFLYPAYVIPWDLRYYHFPIATLAARSLAQFSLPLWDPSIYCGYPIYANPQAQVFYPPALLSILLSNWLAPERLLYFLELQLIAHILLAGIFCYWLLRSLDVSRVPAALGATVFQLGAFFASQTQHLAAVDAAAWLPLVWLALLQWNRHSCLLPDRPSTPQASKSFNLPWLSVLAFAFAMCTLAGFPAVTAVVFGSSLLLALLLVIFREAPVKLFLGWAIAAVLAAALSAIQLLPTLELTRWSVAQYRSDFLGTGGGMPLQSLASLVIPNHYSIFDLNHYSQPWNVTFLYTYCGLVGLALAFAGAIGRSKISRIFGIMALIAAVAMLGDATPVGKSAFLALPRVLRTSIYPHYALAPFTLSMAVLASLGAQKFVGGPTSWIKRLAGPVLLAVTAIDLIGVGSGRPMNTASTKFEPAVTQEQFEGSRELLERLRAMVNQTTPPARIDTIDDSLEWPSTAALTGIPTASGNDPFALIRYMQVRLALAKHATRWGRFYQVAHPESPVLDLLNVRCLLTRTLLPHPPSKLARLPDLPGRAIYENTAVLPRFFLVDRTLPAASMEQALDIVRSPEFQPRDLAVIENALALDRAPSADTGPAPNTGLVRVLHYEPRTVMLETDAPHAAFLVTSEAYYPGWRARIDDREQPLVLTNAAFRGFEIPAGRHHIEMRFSPRIIWYGSAITFAGLIILAYVLLSAIIGRRRWIS